MVTMAYTKQTWADAPSTASPINADRLNHIEEGIEAAAAGGLSTTDRSHLNAVAPGATTKTAADNYYKDIISAIVAGGNGTTVSYNATTKILTIEGLPDGGTALQVLRRTADGTGYEWADAASGGGSELPAGGNANQVLRRNSTNTGIEWADPQLASTDTEAVQDIIGAMLVAGTNVAGNNVTATYNDTNGTLKIGTTAISITGTPGAGQSIVRNAANTAWVPYTPGDGGAATPGAVVIPETQVTEAGDLIRRNSTNDAWERFQFGATGSAEVERIQDIAAALIKAGTGTTAVYDDNAGTLTIGTTVIGLPSGGSASQLLRKNATNTGYEWFTATGGGTPAAPSYGSAGYIRMDDPYYALTPAKISNPAPYDATDNPGGSVVNDLTQIINDAHSQGKYIRVDGFYLIGDPDGDTGTSQWKDKNLRIFGNGGFYIYGPTGIRHIATFSPMVAKTGIATRVIGDSGDRRSVTAIQVDAANVYKFKADMAWQIVANGANSTNATGFYEWSQAPSLMNALTGKTVRAEAFPILGVGFQITPASSTTYPIENDVVFGASSGATMVVSSAEVDYRGGGKRYLITRQVFGTFTVGETIRRGSATGTVLGTIAVQGEVLMKGRTLYPWGGVTGNVSLRKLGGSKGGYSNGDYFTNLDHDMRGISIRPATDPNEAAPAHGFAVALYGIVDYYQSDIKFDGAYRTALYMASTYNGLTTDIKVEQLPNNAQQKVDGYGYAFGYGVEFLGTAAKCIVQSSQFTATRHGVTTNITANSQFLTDPYDTMLHGVQRDLVFRDLTATDNISASFDTHYGAHDSLFINCVAVSSSHGAGEKDSGGACFTNRSWNTVYIGCKAFGGWAGFTDITGGLIYTEGGEQLVNHTRYYDCWAEGYQEMGYRQGIRGNSSANKVTWQNCFAKDNGVASNPFSTNGWDITAINSYLINCSASRNSGSMIKITAGSYYSGTSGGTAFDNTPATDPTGLGIYILGGFFADFSENITSGCDLIEITGPGASAARISLVIGGDVSYIPVTHMSGTTEVISPARAVYNGGGYTRIRMGGNFKNLTSITPVTEVAHASGVSGQMDYFSTGGGGSAPYVGATEPGIKFGGRFWTTTAGVVKVYDSSTSTWKTL